MGLLLLPRDGAAGGCQMIHYTQFWDADIPSDPVVADCTAFYQLIGGVLPNAEDMRKRSHREHVGKSFSISAPPLKRAYPGHRQSPSRTPHESGGGTLCHIKIF